MWLDTPRKPRSRYRERSNSLFPIPLRPIIRALRRYRVPALQGRPRPGRGRLQHRRRRACRADRAERGRQVDAAAHHGRAAAARRGRRGAPRREPGLPGAGRGAEQPAAAGGGDVEGVPGGARRRGAAARGRRRVRERRGRHRRAGHPAGAAVRRVRAPGRLSHRQAHRAGAARARLHSRRQRQGLRDVLRWLADARRAGAGARPASRFICCWTSPPTTSTPPRGRG